MEFKKWDQPTRHMERNDNWHTRERRRIFLQTIKPQNQAL